MSKQPHFFLAVPLVDYVRKQLQSASDELAQKLNFARWVHPADLHITLSFIGSAQFPDILTLKKELAPVVANYEPFSLQLNGFGTFGPSSHPKILWAGVNEHSQLTNLQQDVARVCEAIGFPTDDRPYHPHITLARKWNTKEAFPRESFEKTTIPAAHSGQWQVNETVLYQTHLERTPKYQPLKVFNMQGGS